MTSTPFRRTSRAVLAALALTALAAASALTGCGASAQYPAEAPAAETAAGAAAPAGSPDEALHRLDQAEFELAQILGGPAPSFATPPAGAAPTSAAPITASGPPPPPAAPYAPPTEPRESIGQEVARKDATAQASDDGSRATSHCSIACRALASMSRATDQLCGLAGEVDGRCLGARTRVRSATERVQTQCPSCAP
ncbi:hypothetical protein [Chondromyces apiculatus]|uniref:Uncharacterized protein n=1 Tax=Chondromyces apiculatus DSM 436 TaxID=1192034 RepID=A0A017TGF0_9BACT|nr:hypothetical protein [Chondromyces apiculatus]EYF07661.1 Hypothetical protein CAP_8162 [Chondromyces apiculatus DSM 436]